MKLSYACSLAAVALLAICSPSLGDGVQIPNAGFEDGVGQTAWRLGTNGPCTSPGNAPQVYDGYANGMENVHTGRYSLRYTFNSDKAWQIIDHPVSGGCELVLKAWVRMPTQGSPNTKVLSLDFQGMNDAGQCVWGATSFPNYSGPYAEWTELETRLVAPGPAARILICIHTQNGWGCGAICSRPLWVDDVRLLDSCGAPSEPTIANWRDDQLEFHSLVPYQYAAFAFHENAGTATTLDRVRDEVLGPDGQPLDEPFEQGLVLRTVDLPAGGSLQADVPVWISPLAQQRILGQGLHQIYVRRVFIGHNALGESVEVPATTGASLPPPLANAQPILLDLGPGQANYTSLGDVYRSIRKIYDTADLIKNLGSFQILAALEGWIVGTVGDALCRFILGPVCPDLPCFTFFERSFELLLRIDLDKDGYLGNVTCHGLRSMPAWMATAGTVLGQVQTPAGGPIEGAKVGIVDGSFTVKTDASGQFSLPYLSAGTHSLVVQAEGYEINRTSISVSQGELKWGTIVTLRASGLRGPAPTTLAGDTNSGSAPIAVTTTGMRGTIQFALEAPADVDAGIYDVSGRLVREVNIGPRSAGPNLWEWDGIDARGSSSPSGVYFVRIRTAHESGVGRVLMLR